MLFDKFIRNRLKSLWEYPENECNHDDSNVYSMLKNYLSPEWYDFLNDKAAKPTQNFLSKYYNNLHLKPKNKHIIYIILSEDEVNHKLFMQDRSMVEVETEDVIIKISDGVDAVKVTQWH